MKPEFHGLAPRLLRAVPALVLIACPGLFAQDSPPVSRSLAGNMQVRYHLTPSEVDSLGEMFSSGRLYSRLRSNTFLNRWHDPESGRREDTDIGGLGASLVFKSGVLNGFGFTAGIYATSNPYLRVDREDVGMLKAGKDVIARYDVARDGEFGYVTLGEGFLEWRGERASVRAGRQLFESVFTASNDTKMIPNTFDGVVLGSTLSGVRLRAAWFNGQKLRDHHDAHDLITFRDRHGEPWANQDDAGVHRGLSWSNFAAAGQDADNTLLIGEGSGEFAGLRWRLSASSVPDILAQGVVELARTFAAGDWEWEPALRYFQQFDRGGGAIGGAALPGNISAANPGDYTDPDSLDTSMLAWRLRWRHVPTGMALQFGFSDVEDAGDIVAPWRGFPTGGYTRAMGQYNWRANTRSWMLQLQGEVGRWLPWDGLRMTARYAVMDMDEAKGMSDRNVLNIDLIQPIPRFPGLEMRLRSAFAEDDGPIGYNEYRIEFNYLF